MVRPSTESCGQPECGTNPHPFMREGDTDTRFCSGQPIDLAVRRDGAGHRPTGKRFEEVILEAFEAGWDASTRGADVGDEFAKWRRGMLP